MLSNYLKTAVRHLLRHKVYSGINVVGLATGMACTMLILLWVQDELRFDRFNTHASEIYRILYGRDRVQLQTAGTPAPLGPALSEEIPEVANFVRIAPAPPRTVVRGGDKMFYESRLVFADPALLDIFTFPLVKGTSSHALSGISNVVITEEIARKYFGEEDPMGKTLTLEGDNRFVVSGVLRSIPPQSHLQFDIVLPFDIVTTYHLLATDWGSFNYSTYIQLRPHAFQPGLAQAITNVARLHGCPQVVYGGYRSFLQPLTDVHLDGGVERSGVDVEPDPGERTTVLMFSVIAGLILGIACINFMNLSTAQSEARGREVSVRKALGAQRRQIVGQFLGESVLLSGLACVLAAGLVIVLLPAFNGLTLKHVALDFTDGAMMLELVMIGLLTGLVAGSYPAFYLSSFQPAALLRRRACLTSASWGVIARGMQRLSFRKVLVVMQFSLSIGLIICTLAVSLQLDFMRTTNLGFDRDNVLVVPIKEHFGSNYDAIKQQLLQHPAIRGVAAQEWFQVRGPRNTGGRGYSWAGNPDPDHSPWISHTRVDCGFIELMGIRMLEGRSFSKDHPADATEAFVVNEEAVRAMGLKSPVGKYFRLYGQEGKIIGVMQNACFSSLHQRVEPLVYHLLTNAEDARYGAILVKLQGGKIAEGIAVIEDLWKKENPHSPFEFQFLDEALNSRYATESRTGMIFTWFAGLAIFISCLGLFGLAAFAAERRTKEIGIRRVLGSSVAGIVLLLSKEFTSWVIAANILAWPVAWYAMNAWLERFAYRVDMSLWPCVLAGSTALGIALLTMSAQALRAATANPVDALRYE